MTDFLTPAFLVSVLAAAVAAGTAILFACLGELITERSGVLNLGIEGIMLMGALSGAGACIWSGSAWVGAGVSAFLGRDIVGVPPPSAFRRVDIPVVAEVPVLGRILFQQSALVYISL